MNHTKYQLVKSPIANIPKELSGPHRGLHSKKTSVTSVAGGTIIPRLIRPTEHSTATKTIAPIGCGKYSLNPHAKNQN